MLKNKKILIILLLSIILLGISTSCFAIDNINNSYSESDLYNCFVVADKYMKDNNIIYYDYFVGYEGNIENGTVNVLFIINSDYVCYAEPGSNGRICSNHTYLIQFSGTRNFEISNLVLTDYSATTKWNLSKDLKYSSFPIYYNDGSLFFPLTPLKRMAPIVAQVEMGEIMKEIIKILPLILVVVVSLVGLRKALKMLSTLLHRCLII